MKLDDYFDQLSVSTWKYRLSILIESFPTKLKVFDGHYLIALQSTDVEYIRQFGDGSFEYRSLFSKTIH
jgi:hypothetical protein